MASQTEESPKSLLIVDDHKSHRKELASYLDSLSGFKLVGEAEGIEEAERLVIEKRPHILLVDIKLLDGCGLELTRRIRNNAPETSIVILTSYDIEEYRKTAESYGISGYITKDRLVSELPAILYQLQHQERRATQSQSELYCKPVVLWLPITTAREVAEVLRQIMHVDPVRWQTPHWQLIRALLVIVCLQLAVRIYWTVGVLIGDLAATWSGPIT